MLRKKILIGSVATLGFVVFVFYISSATAVEPSGYCGIYGDSAITTFAGNGRNGFLGDGGLAINASLISPTGIAGDTSGNMYITSFIQPRIRKVDPIDGIITTIAGNGMQSSSGDGGPAINAMLKTPYFITTDRHGNIYFSEADSDRVRKIDTSGIITTIAGNGTPGDSGDSGLATAAQFFEPSGIAVDVSGNVYIADEESHRIRKVDTSGIITTFAGNGTEGFSGDGGLAVRAQLSSVSSLALDVYGNVYMGDYANNRVRKVDTNGVITTIAGNGRRGFSGDGGPATSAQLNGTAVAMNNFGELYILGDERIRKVDANGIITTIAGNGTWGFSGDGGPAVMAQISPFGHPTVDYFGDLYFIDTGGVRNDNHYRIRKISCSTCDSLENGTICSDANACTTGDVCGNGACVAGAARICTALDQCHTAGICNPATGVCSSPASPNGTVCNDGNICTTGDVCRNGTCAGRVCETPPNSCYRVPGTCGVKGCFYQALPDGGKCRKQSGGMGICRKGVCQ